MPGWKQIAIGWWPWWKNAPRSGIAPRRRGWQHFERLEDRSLLSASNLVALPDAAWEPANVDLDVDTDRDGTVQDLADEEGESRWVIQRGAIYNVNFDRDGDREADGTPIPDAIHFDSFGTPVHEDFKIENADDELDIAPLVIRKIADEIPAGYRVVLRAAELEDVRRIHVFKKISSAPSNTAIWGRATGESPPAEIDITRWVDPASPTFQGDPITGDTTFGIEGLFFRYVGNDALARLRFDGYIDLTLQLRKGTTVVSTDSVRLKVAPWIMLSRDQASEELWTAAVGLGGIIEHPRQGIVDGETFTISDGHVTKIFEFDTEADPGVDAGHVAVSVPRAGPVSEVGDAIVTAINRQEAYSIFASVVSSDLPGEPANQQAGLVRLFHTDVTVHQDQVPQPTETVADPRFKIAMSGDSTNQAFLRTELADDGYVGLDNSDQLNEVVGPDAENQWFQDHVEIGYTQRPGGPKTHVVFRLPYWRGTSSTNPIWPMTRLLGQDVGTFQLGVSLGGGSGDFGGNLETLTSNRTQPLGRIIMGNRVSEKLRQFLISQEVQDPIFNVPVRWLKLGHIDEVTSFLAGGQVVIADPTRAWNLLSDIPEQDRGRSVFFATGAMPQSGVARADSYMANRIQTGFDHRGQPWKYIRIYEGAAQGTVAEIDELGDGFITVKRVWRTGGKIIDGSGPDRDINYWRKHLLPTTANWSDAAPKRGDKYVLVEDTQFSLTGTPAVVSVSEILADQDFADLNKIDVQGVMDQTRELLESRAPSGALTFIEVPSLFFGRRDGARGVGFLSGRSAEAFNPGPANLQAAGGKLFVGRQFAPRDQPGNDLFEEAIKTALNRVVRQPRPVDFDGVRRPTTEAIAEALLGNRRGEQDIQRVGPPQKFVRIDDRAGKRTIAQSNPAGSGVVVTKIFKPLSTWGHNVQFVDDWNTYHRLIGNIHCGTVVKRAWLDFDWWSEE